MFSFVKRTFSVLDRSARIRFLLFALGSVGVAVLEALSVSLVLPLTQLLLSTPGDPLPTAARAVDRLVGVSSAEEAAAFLAVLVLLTLTVKSVAAVFLLRWGIGNSLKQEARLARHIFARYLLAPTTFHMNRNSAEIQRTLNESMLMVFRRTVPFVLAASADFVALIAITSVIVVQDTQVALVAIAYFALVALLYQRLIGGRQKVAARHAHMEVAQRYRQVQEAVRATKELAVLHRHEYFIRAFYRTKLELVSAQRLLAFYQLMPRHFLDLALIFGAAAVAAFTFSTRDTPDALASVGLFLAASFRLVAPLNRVMGTFTLTRTAQPAIDQVVGDLAELDALRDRRDSSASGALAPSRVEVDQVRFRYTEVGPDVLDGVSMTIEVGDDIGIVGTSGAGKTTLLDVLLGLLDPCSGEVRIGGRPLPGVRADWQLSIGYVPQEIVLLDDTVRANVAFGVEAARIDEAAVAEAVRLAQLDEFVANLPKGLDTGVGEDGVRLSGGQRQRLGLARALYHRPSVLVLDEATSALDSDTESRVIATLAALRGRLTIITVSHRLSTLKHCDRIYFLREGRVAAVGTFDELYDRDPEFAQLVSLAQLSLSGAQATAPGAEAKKLPGEPHPASRASGSGVGKGPPMGPS